MKRFLQVLPDKTSLIVKAQEIILTKIETAIATKGYCTIALAGGSTPKPLYESLATQNLPWDKIHIFWGDERYVAAGHPDSNQLMARQAWLDKVAIPDENIHPMNITHENPAQDAATHERELRDFFQIAEGEFPVFDLILLGIGDDAHTASLFPQTEVLQETQKAISVGNKDGQPRITFTVPLINQADCVLFLVAGANKRDALNQIFSSDADNQIYPARLIQPQGELWWLLDDTAGKLLQNDNISLIS